MVATGQLPSWLRSYAAGAYTWIFLVLVMVAGACGLALTWDVLLRPVAVRLKRVKEARRARERGATEDELMVRRSLEAAREAATAAEEEAKWRKRVKEASRVFGPRDKEVFWDCARTANGAEVSFWVLRDQDPIRMSLGFRFVRGLREPVELWVDEDLLRPTVENDKTKVIVRFEVPRFRPGMMGRLRVLSEDGRPLGVPPVVGWHYP